MAPPFQSSVLTLHFPLPPHFGWNYPQAGLLPVWQQFPSLKIFKISRTCCIEALYLRHLPPLVVTGVGHVENVPVVEAEAAARQPVVPVRVVLEQRAHVERPLGAGAHERARDVLLQLVQARLVPVVLVRLVLHTQLHHAARALQHLDHTHWVNTTPKAAEIFAIISTVPEPLKFQVDSLLINAHLAVS